MLRGLIASALGIVLAVTMLSCATHAAKPPQTDADQSDPDAASAETWAARHARGTTARAAGVTPAHDLGLAPLAQTAPLLMERVDIAPDLAAFVARARVAPATSDTPTERVAGVVVVAAPGEDPAPAFWAFAVAGFVAIAPLSPHAGEFFGEVDDAKRAARFLAQEPDVDLDHLYAFGDGRVACQLALDPDAPFRAVGALGATTTSTFADLSPLDERIARALLPHASEVSTRLIVYAPADDPRALAVHQRNAKIEIDSAKNALTAFRQLIERDATTSPALALTASSRFAL